MFVPTVQSPTANALLADVAATASRQHCRPPTMGAAGVGHVVPCQCRRMPWEADPATAPPTANALPLDPSAMPYRWLSPLPSFGVVGAAQPLVAGETAACRAIPGPEAAATPDRLP